MPASTGRSAGTGVLDDPYAEARRKLAQRERAFTARGDYETQAREARENFLRPEVQEYGKYGQLGVQAPPEVAGYTGGNPLVSGRPLTTLEQLERSFEGEDIAAERARIAKGSASGGGYATSAGRPMGGRGSSPYAEPIVGVPFGTPPPVARPIGAPAPSGGSRTRTGAGGGGEDDVVEQQMAAVGLVPTKFTSDGRSNSIAEYVRPEEAQIRKQRNSELVKEEYGRRFGPDPRLRSKYANLSEAAVVEYATEGTLYPSEDPNNPYGSDEGNDAALITELRSRRDKDGQLAFADPDIEVILRSVRAERKKRRTAASGGYDPNKYAGQPGFGVP